jgi:cysteine desulfurase
MEDSILQTIYLDNNATTKIPPIVIKAVTNWMNCGNPSSNYYSAELSRKLMSKFRDLIKQDCDIGDDFSLIFTSGGTESNCSIVNILSRAYRCKTKKKPHIITSVSEHKSILKCVKDLEIEGVIEATYVPLKHTSPHYGSVDPLQVRDAIKSNTCLITIMTANNETGIINNITKIGQIAKERNVPFHTDAVQLFGKSLFRPNRLHIDSFSVSFHKFHGPTGIGILGVRNSLIKGYELCAHITGSQNEGLRGGTENIPGIAGAFMAMKLSLQQRSEKITMARRMRDHMWNSLSSQFLCMYLEDYRKNRDISSAKLWKQVIDARTSRKPIIVQISQKEDTKMPNTLLLAVYDEGKFCGGLCQKELVKQNIIVSVGSACNASDEHASHVVKAMGVPEELLSGVIRISVSDDNTATEIQKFIDAFIKILRSKTCLLGLTVKQGE